MAGFRRKIKPRLKATLMVVTTVGHLAEKACIIRYEHSYAFVIVKLVTIRLKA